MMDRPFILASFSGIGAGAGAGGLMEPLTGPPRPLTGDGPPLPLRTGLIMGLGPPLSGPLLMAPLGPLMAG